MRRIAVEAGRGLEVTLPRPVPPLVSVNVGLTKLAVITRSPFSVALQVGPDTASHPLQPVTLIRPGMSP